MKYLKKIIIFLPAAFFLLGYPCRVSAQDPIIPAEFEPEDEGSEQTPFEYSRDKWLEMRQAIEEGREPGEAPQVVISTAPIELPPMAPGGVVEELPYETKLSITGRKLIGIDLKQTKYLHEVSGRNSDDSQVDMQQELQVKIKGQVGKKIGVNVDFDDTQPDKRDISVNYKGDPDEIVQEAAFGDIDASLRQTEFVGYRKQVFGAKIHAKYKNADGVLIWSQSKGTPDTQRFTGNAQMEKKSILDINYVRWKYYQLVFGTTDTIKPGTERIFLDDRNPTNDFNALDVYVSSYPSAGTYAGDSKAGKFDLLKAGVDYTVDYYRGIIVFRKYIYSNYVIAVDYEKNSGGMLSASLGTGNTSYILIKDEYETEGVTWELKNYYDVGKTNITPDNGLNNFTLYIQDASNNPAENMPKYIRNSEDTGIKIDFETGIFFTTDTRPFPADVYRTTKVTAGYKFFIEYRYLEKDFSLRHSPVVPESERVIMDGLVLARNVDYTIDYDSAKVYFEKNVRDRINENTIIDISYEYGSMLGMEVGETLLGARGEFQIARNMFAGASWLSTTAPGTQSVPDVRSAPGSQSVGEADVRLTDLSLKPLPLSVSVSGEVAQSRSNPNTRSKAIVNSMEGITREDGTALEDDYWQFARTPGGDLFASNAVGWIDQEANVLDINPQAVSYRDEKQRVLEINYDLSGGTECSVVQSLSRSGEDYSEKLYLELWIFGDGANEDLQIDLARQINEDTDGDGRLDTEDMPPLNGVLDLGEDIGMWYDVDGASVGVNNKRLDSEDLNRDNYLDTMEQIAGSYRISDGWVWVDTTTNISHTATSVDWTGWKYFRVPLGISDTSNWSKVKQLRITINGPGKTGTLQFAKISVVGNEWKNLTPGPLEVFAVNNQDNPEYAKNGLKNSPLGEVYDDLYNNTYTSLLTDRREQAISLQYGVTDYAVIGTTEVAVKTDYKPEQDFSQYHKFNFFLYGARGIGEEFFIQAGADDNNYFEFNTVMQSTGVWRLITIEQADTGGFQDGIPDTWTINASEGNCTIKGKPSLTRISRIKMGVRASSGTSGEVWVNEIHVTESWERVGTAQRLNVDFNLPGWMTFGANLRSLDRNFKTINSNFNNLESNDRSAYLNFTRVNFMPVSVRVSESITKSPSETTTGEFVSVLQEGQSITRGGSIDTSLNIKNLPGISFNYSQNISSYNNPGQNIFRVDDSKNKSLNTSYSFPRVFSKLGVKFIDPIIPTSISGSWSQGMTDARPWDIYQTTSNPRIETERNNYSGNVSWNFWQVLNNFRVNYSKSLDVGKDSAGSFIINDRYNKSSDQSGGVGTSLNLARWFSPSLSYNVSMNEIYNFPASTTKTINRNGSGNYSWNVSAKDIFPHLALVQSLYLDTNYSFSGGDKYENVFSSFTDPGEFRINERLELPESRTVMVTDTQNERYTLRWDFGGVNFLKGRWQPLKRTTLNYSSNKSNNFTNTTGTKSRRESETLPDLTMTVYEVEKIFGIGKIISGSRITYDTKYEVNRTKSGDEDKLVDSSKSYSRNLSTNFNLPKNFSITYTQSLSRREDEDFNTGRITAQNETNDWSVTLGFDLWQRRFTPRYSYNRTQTWPGDRNLADVTPTSDLTTRSTGIGFRWDTSFPAGMKLPIINKVLPLTNRFVFDASLNWTGRESSYNVTSTNTDQNVLSVSADYDLSQNFRCKLGGGLTQFRNRSNPENDYDSLNINFQLTIMF